VLGVRVHPLTLRQVLALTLLAAHTRERITITYANVHAINLAHDLPWFRTALNSSTITFCDGFGVKWGAQALGQRLPERFTPPDWLHLLAQAAARQGASLYLLGARPGVAAQAAARLQAQFPALQIAGTHHGYFDHAPGSAADARVLMAINAAQPAILIVGMGMPLQEHWLHTHRAHLDVPVALTVGAAFDYLAGTTPRGPAWMTDYGLEWLARLLVEPRRLWRRYVLGNPRFVWRVAWRRFVHLIEIVRAVTFELASAALHRRVLTDTPRHPADTQTPDAE
jgi:N-acetylglucosaminyldiphosphoundecaprenol N-acetyl-beta-D-mannosaminyltransferase